MASGRAGKVRLEYNTNLTMVPTKLIKLWEQFKQVRIGVSIDGVGDVFDYQRTPAKWSSVYRNMQRLEEADVNLKAWYAFTVTPYNVFHFPEFMRWKLEESGLDSYNPVTGPRPIVTHHMCHSPKYYNVKVLPPELKQQVVEHYDTFRVWIQSTDYNDHIKQSFEKLLDGVQKFMLSEDYSEQWLPEFVKTTRRLDEIRNQNVLDIVPQYKDLFDG